MVNKHYGKVLALDIHEQGGINRMKVETTFGEIEPANFRRYDHRQ